MPEAGTVTALWAWYGDGGVQGRAGLYSDAGSAPGTLITMSQVVPVGGGFKRMDVPDRLLPAGRYYLAAQSSNTCGFGMGTSSSMINSLAFAVPDWPQTYPGGGLVQGSYELCAWAEYCPVDTPTPTPSETGTPTATPTVTATSTITPTWTSTCSGGADAFTLQWTPVSATSAVRDAAAVELDGYSYRIGGYWRGGFPATDYYYDWVARYDPTSDSWSPQKYLNHARSALAAAQAGGRIYVFGGYYSGTVQAHVEVFHPDLGTWFDLTPVPTPVFYPMAAAVGTTIYLMGGNNGTQSVSNVYAYDTVGGGWSARAPLPTPCYASGVGVLDGKVYLAGGNGDSGAHRDRKSVV